MRTRTLFAFRLEQWLKARPLTGLPGGWYARARGRVTESPGSCDRVRRLAPHSHKRTHTPKLSYTSCQLELEPSKQSERKGPPSLDWRRVRARQPRPTEAPGACAGRRGETGRTARCERFGLDALRARSHVGSASHAARVLTPYTLCMPGGVPLATCTLPVGMFYLLTYRPARVFSHLTAQGSLLSGTRPFILMTAMFQ